MSALEFFLGLLENVHHSHVGWEDFQGPHGRSLQLFQRMGFISIEAGMNPVPSCPHCYEGVPYRLEDRLICALCRSIVDRRHLLLWSLRIEAFLRWLALALRLRGAVRLIEAPLYHLGRGIIGGVYYECFFRGLGNLSNAAANRIAVFRNVIIFYAITPPANSARNLCISLLDILRLSRTLTVAKTPLLLPTRDRVRFDASTGGLFVGDRLVGEVPLGTKEHALLACLAEHLDAFVTYADLKHFILARTGSTDATEEATFCQKLKSRIKKRIPQIDRLIVTTNKGDGYRLRMVVEIS